MWGTGTCYYYYYIPKPGRVVSPGQRTRSLGLLHEYLLHGVEVARLGGYHQIVVLAHVGRTSPRFTVARRLTKYAARTIVGRSCSRARVSRPTVGPGRTGFVASRTMHAYRRSARDDDGPGARHIITETGGRTHAHGVYTRSTTTRPIDRTELLVNRGGGVGTLPISCCCCCWYRRAIDMRKKKTKKKKQTSH